ncbi:MAG: hypothetical protein ACFCU2_08900 [Acidimicrobiia bacterium]
MKKLAESRVLVVLVLALVVASCGGESGADDATTAPSEGVTTTTAAEPDDDTDDGDSGGLDGLSSTCLEAAQGMAAAVSAYSTGMAQAFGGSLDDESLQLSAEQLEAMAEAAPDEIKDDLDVIAAQLGDFYTALAESGYEPGATPDADQLAALSALAESFDNEAFEEASDNINAWFEANC